jgi:hypothetical protein
MRFKLKTCLAGITSGVSFQASSQVVFDFQATKTLESKVGA